jgi:hypothetical protein
VTEPQKLTWKGRLIAFGVSAIICAVAIEGGARILEAKSKIDAGGLSTLQVNMQPYMVFTSQTGRHPTWLNVETGKKIPSLMTYNSLGFMGDVDYTLVPNQKFLKAYAKGPDDKIVLITGGSVVHGVGATSNEKTTAGQLEAILNSKQNRYRYRVVNLGMGSWISYQQFVGLSLFGLPIKPDWIVVMDGHNDASVSCPHGSGPANPMNWPQMLYMTGGGQGTSLKGSLLKWAIEHTAVARMATGLKPESDRKELSKLEFDTNDPDPRFRIKSRGLTFGELDEQVDFYVRSQENVKELFFKANILFSTQPVLSDNAITPWYRKAFDLEASEQEATKARERLKADLDAYMAKSSSAKCSYSLSAPSLGYFLARSALRLEKMVPAWNAESSQRSIRYANTEMILPGAFAMRVANFVDNAHMSDLGQRKVAEYFAGYILETDLKVSFDAAAFARAAHEEALEAYWPRAARFAYSLPSVPIRPGTPATVHQHGVTVEEASGGVVRITERQEEDRHYVVWAGMPPLPGHEKVLSIDVWSDTVPVIVLETLEGPEKYGRADVDLALGKVTYRKGAIQGAQVRDLGRGWKRITLECPPSDDSFLLTVAMLSDDGSAKYPGTGRSIAVTPPVLTQATTLR